MLHRIVINIIKMCI